MTREEVESIIENLSSDSDESSIDKAIQVVDQYYQEQKKKLSSRYDVDEQIRLILSGVEEFEALDAECRSLLIKCCDYAETDSRTTHLHNLRYDLNNRYRCRLTELKSVCARIENQGGET